MAATKTTALRGVAAPVRPERRRLANNVICLFPEDRPPVINPPRRGRLPSCVVPARRLEELRHAWQQPGAVAELCGTVRSENKGVRVRLIGKKADGCWLIETVRGELTVEGGERVSIAHTPPKNLRRAPGASYQHKGALHDF